MVEDQDRAFLLFFLCSRRRLFLVFLASAKSIKQVTSAWWSEADSTGLLWKLPATAGRDRSRGLGHITGCVLSTRAMRCIAQGIDL